MKPKYVNYKSHITILKTSELLVELPLEDDKFVSHYKRMTQKFRIFM